MGPRTMGHPTMAPRSSDVNGPLRTTQNRVCAWEYASDRRHAGCAPIELDVLITDPAGQELTVPAFQAGEGRWGVRYASAAVGRHRFVTRCSDPTDPALHGRTGVIEVEPGADDGNPLFRHGPLRRMTAGARHLEHADGTPFLWLADTWWMGLVGRLDWPEGFQRLAADRAGKGFSVVLLVAGLYPDMPPFDPRGANEAGFPWSEGFGSLNPAWFDAADRRIAHLVELGMVPAIVGSWGYFMQFAGAGVLRRHWRNLIARYGAYPVVWCIAGEALMPFYTSELWGDLYRARIARSAPTSEPLLRHQDRARAEWTAITRYVRSADPYRRPVSIHPSSGGWSLDLVEDASLLDLDMAQCGLHDLVTAAGVMQELDSRLDAAPRLPRLLGEGCYEGEGGWNWENVQRLLFWGSMLRGTAGHTYGASGIWQVNTRDAPFGHDPRVFGDSFDDDPWDVAMGFAGSTQVGLGKRLLERYRWWRFRPHGEWITWVGGHYYEPLAGALRPLAAGIPGEVRVIFIPTRCIVTVCGIEPDARYRATWFDPRRGREHDAGMAAADGEGRWQPPRPPIIQDWVLVLETSEARIG